jgi:hypothetical protein
VAFSPAGVKAVSAMQYRRAWPELAAITAIAWLALACIPLGLGYIGLSWDALNHHLYLGWTADHPRFELDFLAASYQSYEFPYLFWPAYKLAEWGASGRTAGVVLVSLHVLAVPALWLAANACIAGTSWYERFMRAAAVLLALSGEVFLSLMDNTANDGLAAVPLVWAVALAIACTQQGAEAKRTARLVAISGLLAGVSTAFKLSNGPLALGMPLVWAFCGDGTLGARAIQVARGCVWTLVGFALTYGYWGWQLWTHFGNPLYPFFAGWFAEAAR